MKHFKLNILIFIICISACQNDSSKNEWEGKISPEETSLLHLLIFKKENKLELWGTGKDSKIFPIKTFTSVFAEETPIGIFLLKQNKSPHLILDFPNDIYGAQIGNEAFEDIHFLDKITGTTNRQSIVFNKKELNELKKLLHPKIKTQAFVFPNDMRTDGTFNACFGCPHQMAELYSSLELHLKQFVN